MANGKLQVPFHVGETVRRPVSAGEVTLKTACCLSDLAEGLLHIHCLQCYAHTEQIPLHSDSPKWLSNIKSTIFLT